MSASPHRGDGRSRGHGRAPRGMPRPPGHGMFAMPVQRARDFRGTVRKLVAYLRPHRLTFVAVFFMALGSTLFSVVGPKILGQATTALFNGLMAQVAGTGVVPFDTIGRILLTALGLYLVSALFGYLQGWLMSGVAMKVTYELRRNLMDKIHRMPFRYFDGTTHGEVLSLFTNDVEAINQSLTQSLTQVVTSTATVLGILAMMLSISWEMTLVALLVVPLSGATVTFIVKRSQRFFRQQQDDLGRVNSLVEETFGAHLVVKAFNAEARAIRRFEEANARLYAAAWKALFFSGLMMPMMRFIGNLGYVFVVILGGWLAVQGRITVGDIQAFMQYVRSFTQPITQMANISNMLQQMVAAAERIFEFLEQPEEPPDPPKPVLLKRVRGHVVFQNVTFGYLPGQPVIQDFSAEVLPGQRVAIVGPTGAGKTTLVKLLMRFYDVDQGAILIDGHDIRRFRRSDLRRLFGMVLQDTWLFNGTILENIRYGRPEATDEEVMEAARMAHADHFIRSLPGGYHFVLNEEVTNISQGQKQLITIARAFLANPPMLILDEATSNVDTYTERLIQQAMERLMQGRTSFVIAHRLSTIQDADLILVMREGRLVEQGTHEELLRRGGFYAALYYSQFEPAVAEEP